MTLTGSTEQEAIEHFERMAEHKKLLDALMPPEPMPAIGPDGQPVPPDETEDETETESNEDAE
jgi:hypothetical protein